MATLAQPPVRPWRQLTAAACAVLAAGVAVVLLEPDETRVADAPVGVGSTGE